MNQEEFDTSIDKLAASVQEQLSSRSKNITWKVEGTTEGFDARFRVKAEYEYGQYTCQRVFEFDLDRRPFDLVRVVNTILDFVIRDLALQVFSPKFMKIDEQ